MGLFIKDNSWGSLQDLEEEMMKYVHRFDDERPRSFQLVTRSQRFSTIFWSWL